MNGSLARDFQLGRTVTVKTDRGLEQKSHRLLHFARKAQAAARAPASAKPVPGLVFDPGRQLGY